MIIQYQGVWLPGIKHDLALRTAYICVQEHEVIHNRERDGHTLSQR